MVFDQLAKLLEPCLPQEFLGSVWGQTYKHMRGPSGRFSHLLPWERLNEILKRHRLDFPRLRLTRDGQSLPASTYLTHLRSGQQQRAATTTTTIARLRPTQLTAELGRGATLVLDAVDELYEPLEELAAGLERAFQERVQINAYAGWRTTRGFDLHWDDHDVFILQVTGRKRWSLYGMTRPYPVAGDTKTAHKPEGSAVWEETLEDGDLLYIPRGWWHVALPLNEPTLHLTVGIHNRTGLDLLKWLEERLRASATFRRDLPRFASRAEQEAHVAELRAGLLAEWGDDLLERFYAHCDANAQPRPSLSLPWSAMPEALPPSNETRVRLTAPRRLELESAATEEQAGSQEQAGTEGILEFACQGKRWRFARAALAVLGPLNTGRDYSVSELCAAAAETLTEQTVRTFLGELIRHGLLAIVRDNGRH
jgi:ribosomal protein L16 Arg81 hydroxylase